MARAKRRLNATAMALSIAAHAVVLTAAALHAPKLEVPHEQAGPPQPIIPVLIMPRTPPVPPGSTEKPQPIRLHRRQLRHEPPPPNVAPVTLPKAPPAPAPTRPRPAPAARTVQPSPSAQISSALRASPVGCANPALLSPGERDRCLERFGRGAHEAAHLGPALNPAKQAAFDRAAQAKRARRRANQAGVPVGVAGPEDSGASDRNRPLEMPILPPLRP